MLLPGLPQCEDKFRLVIERCESTVFDSVTVGELALEIAQRYRQRLALMVEFVEQEQQTVDQRPGAETPGKLGVAAQHVVQRPRTRHVGQTPLRGIGMALRPGGERHGCGRQQRRKFVHYHAREQRLAKTWQRAAMRDQNGLAMEGEGRRRVPVEQEIGENV